jgi:hypothetical protein
MERPELVFDVRGGLTQHVFLSWPNLSSTKSRASMNFHGLAKEKQIWRHDYIWYLVDLSISKQSIL